MPLKVAFSKTQTMVVSGRDKQDTQSSTCPETNENAGSYRHQHSLRYARCDYKEPAVLPHGRSLPFLSPFGYH